MASEMPMAKNLIYFSSEAPNEFNTIFLLVLVVVCPTAAQEARHYFSSTKS